ncbi:NADH:flavin oxidoreductase [Ktedonosporobacter rubrisoli]|uniref:NADH:flavin oxidoreductase n=1 Tax=Ktedonosporobacter rubrisoli TaxID=2509675 RepID=A0A4V0YYM0_KTERU|nr:NADH:flavin oxidoreductase [Ktedonosporobacter rubrisoli]QBD76691.1 NADH:flavin oxidoreductase [Ktedonosporobacter rubrisoli]
MQQNVAHSALTPFSLAGLKLKNRVAVAPMSRVSTAGDGVATEQMLDYYTAFARGNFSLIITEGTYIDQAYSQSYANQPGIVTPEQVQAWRHIVDSVHAAGAHIFLQLMHAGALSQGNNYRAHTIAPSAVQPQGEMLSEYGGHGPYARPQAMTEQDIKQVIEGFARAAVQARAAGFDGVEIHGANGYLIDQFITDYTNQRTDRYGGSTEKRIRFALEVVEAIRSATGKHYPVGIRLSQTKVNDFVYRWPGGHKDASIIFSALAGVGVAYIHVASEGRNWTETAMLGNGSTITQLAREVAGVPVIANGGMHDPQQAEQILRDGHADLIALARGALANPDWPRRLQEDSQLEAFEHAMISPQATLENTRRWLAEHKAIAGSKGK